GASARRPLQPARGPLGGKRWTERDEEAGNRREREQQHVHLFALSQERVKESIEYTSGQGPRTKDQIYCAHALRSDGGSDREHSSVGRVQRDRAGGAADRGIGCARPVRDGQGHAVAGSAAAKAVLRLRGAAGPARG